MVIEPGSTVVGLLAGVSFVSGGIALYVRLSFSDMIIKTLNGRYPTTKVMEAMIQSINDKLDALQSRLDALPCQNDAVCNAHAELDQAREALNMAIHEFKGRHRADK